MTTLRLENVSVAHAGKLLFAPLNIEVGPKEIAVIMGPSGVGKSSLLNAICGTLPYGLTLSGQILLDDQRLDPLPCEDRRVGILYQDALLFPHLTVLSNLVIAQTAGISRADKKAKAFSALEHVSLEHLAHADPATLSGGQRSRIALMRTLLNAPKLLLLDEPFSALDRALRQDIRRFVQEHLQKEALPAILVTHDEEDAGMATDDVIHLEPEA